MGTFDEVVTATYNVTLEEALNLLINHNVPALPIVDENGFVVDYYSRSDTRVDSLLFKHFLAITIKYL